MDESYSSGSYTVQPSMAPIFVRPYLVLAKDKGKMKEVKTVPCQI